MLYRCTVGHESPEMAKSLLLHEMYIPLSSSDIWALGQLMLSMVGGEVPDAHWDLQHSEEYLTEVATDCLKPHQAPAQRQHLQYLCDRLDAEADYADEVSPGCLGTALHRLCITGSVVGDC